MKRMSIGKYIGITTIVLLNILGISYASWQDDHEITAKLSSGNVTPIFCERYFLDEIKGAGDLDISFIEDSKDKRTTMYIEGTIDTKYKAFLHYCLKNDGSIPIKFVSQHQRVDEGLELQLNQQSEVLDPGRRFYNETENPKLQIQAGDEEGEYRFEFELEFRQWNK